MQNYRKLFETALLMETDAVSKGEPFFMRKKNKSLFFFDDGDVFLPVIDVTKDAEDWKQGKNISDIAENVIAQIKDAKDQFSKTGETWFSFDAVKNAIYAKLQRNNAVFELPHREFLDMSVSYFILHESGCMPVTQTLADSWGITETELWDIAKVNMPRDFPYIVQQLSAYTGMEEDANKLVITNRIRFCGSSAFLYNTILKSETYWVVPASSHECILVPEKDAQYMEVLRALKKANAQNCQNIIMSDRPYLLDNGIMTFA